MKLTDSHGSVIPYTRHTPGCPHRLIKDHNSCRCPKWLYENPRGGKPWRHTLNTPSWAEALRIAANVHKGFDPEIARARGDREKRESRQVTVADACSRWLDNVKRRNGDQGAWLTYRSVANKVIDWATRNNILFIGEVTTTSLDSWAASDEWTRYSPLTQRQRWHNLRQMFSYLSTLKIIDENPALPIKAVQPDGDPVQGPYTQEQTDAMFAHIADSLEGDPGTRAIRVQRLHAMLTLLLNGGCDLIDATLFRQEMIEKMRIDGRDVWVYQYFRSKTGGEAVVPLSNEIVQTLRSVPPLPGYSEEMPFRSGATDPDTDARFWGHRIRRVLKAAGVEYVTLPATGRSRERQRAANPKQLRHTFAVRQLIAGHRPEVVARMLGHVDATMVRKHYAPFIPELREAHVRLVLQHWD